MFIQDNLDSRYQLSINRATQLLNVSRSGYYKWKGEIDDPASSIDDMAVRDKIQDIALEYPRYGYRRVTAELRNQGYTINRKRVLRLMREDNLLCVRKGFRPITTDSDHNLRRYPNLIEDLEVNRMNQVWASDITYIRLPREFVYLAVMLDLFSRRCIGWDLGRNIDTQLTLNALSIAIEERWNENITGLIHHSDQGVQYASQPYVDCLDAHRINISMGSRGNPYDNAYVESFIKTLKYEEVYLKEYETFSDALDNISVFIEEVYNTKRLHSSLGYLSPVQFEKEVSLYTLA
jgi:transposase InsO family protein